MNELRISSLSHHLVLKFLSFFIDNLYLFHLTKADPAPASHALANTGVTSRDAQQLTLGNSTLNSPATERTDLNRLQALAIPPEDTPKYLSQLTPPTPIDINNLASFLQGHTDLTIVNHLLTGFSQGFKIDYSGPKVSTGGGRGPFDG